MWNESALALDMGQFEVWCGKLFMWSGERLGMVYVKDL